MVCIVCVTVCVCLCVVRLEKREPLITLSSHQGRVLISASAVPHRGDGIGVRLEFSDRLRDYMGHRQRVENKARPVGVMSRTPGVTDREFSYHTDNKLRL